MARAALGIAAAAALLALPLAAGGAAPESPAPALRALVRPGEKAPAFRLEGLDGRAVSVRPGDRKPLVIVFFSVFCPLCRELAPSVAELAAHRGAGIRFVAVNLDGRRFSNAVRSFVDEYGIRFPVLLDEIRDDMFLASDPYGVDKTPTAVVIDGRGIVRGAWAAEAMRDLLRDFDRVAGALEKGNGVAK